MGASADHGMRFFLIFTCTFLLSDMIYNEHKVLPPSRKYMSVLVVFCYTGLITIVNHLYCYGVLSKRFGSYYDDVEDFEEVFIPYCILLSKESWSVVGFCLLYLY